jgi:methylthioribose-1-phosphate isomerase
MVSPMRWDGEALLLLDQTRLPSDEEWLRCTAPEQVADAISQLAVRGAPAIGVAAAYGLALAARDGGAERVHAAAELLRGTRPTAVNLGWAIDRVLGRTGEAELQDAPRQELATALVAVADEIAREQLDADRRIAEHGASLLPGAERVLTHCNTGALATGGAGTALGVILEGWRRGLVREVLVDETRPLLQGARLTAWELARAGVPYRLVPDASAGALIASGLVGGIVVGADRIAANGDVANKIGTYPLAVLAQRHGIPFYVAAPVSTLDVATPDGDAIEIEQRPAEEVTGVLGVRVAPEGAAALNLAFDVTPHDLVTAIVTEAGVLEPPYEASIAAAAGAS